MQYWTSLTEELKRASAWIEKHLLCCIYFLQAACGTANTKEYSKNL